jgi:hypothetical protein
VSQSCVDSLGSGEDNAHSRGRDREWLAAPRSLPQALDTALTAHIVNGSQGVRACYRILA